MLPWLWIPIVTVTAMLLNVLFHVTYMVIYSHILKRGHPPNHYHDHAQRSAPWSSVLLGMPLMYFAGIFVSSQVSADILLAPILFSIWGLYLTIDVGILFMLRVPRRMLAIASLSHSTKLIAILYGGGGGVF